MPQLQRYTYFLVITAILGTSISTTQAQTTQESIDKTQSKILEAAESVAQTTSKLTDNAQEAFFLGLKEGKIESLLFFNKHLNGYMLNAQVEGNRAILTGQVAKAIEKDYAEQLVMSIKGIDGVTNDIVVNHNAQKTALGTTTHTISSTFKDASITASIKTKLLANLYVSGMKVNVDTTNKEVLLNGKAQSILERDLIEQIASNTPGVQRVINKIKISTK